MFSSVWSTSGFKISKKEVKTNWMVLWTWKWIFVGSRLGPSCTILSSFILPAIMWIITLCIVHTYTNMHTIHTILSTCQSTEISPKLASYATRVYIGMFVNDTRIVPFALPYLHVKFEIKISRLKHNPTTIPLRLSETLIINIIIITVEWSSNAHFCLISGCQIKSKLARCVRNKKVETSTFSQL